MTLEINLISEYFARRNCADYAYKFSEVVQGDVNGVLRSHRATSARGNPGTLSHSFEMVGNATKTCGIHSYTDGMEDYAVAFFINNPEDTGDRNITTKFTITLTRG